MKKGFVALCAFVALVFAGCNNDDLGWTRSQEYLYTTYLELSDTTYINPVVSDAEFRMDTMVFSMLNDEDLAGRVSFSASDLYLDVVDAMLVKQVRDKYFELLPGVRAVDYVSMLAVGAPFYRGKFMVVYCVRLAGFDDGKYIERDTIGLYELTGPVPLP